MSEVKREELSSGFIGMLFCLFFPLAVLLLAEASLSAGLDKQTSGEVQSQGDKTTDAK